MSGNGSLLGDEKFIIDPEHEAMDLFDQEITQHIWKEKYRYYDEAHPFDSFKRVVEGVYAKDTEQAGQEGKALALEAMKKGLWMPAGRIQAGAGTSRRVTLINCYVVNTIGDSLRTNEDSPGIFDSLANSAYTLQMGGGIGHDFSTLRPGPDPERNIPAASVKRVDADASGPLSFMDVWDAMCKTIMSAGARRGAMMATMRCDHPNIFQFVEAKAKQGRLTQFNVSVLVTDAFIEAVASDRDWRLMHEAPPVNEDEYGSTLTAGGVKRWEYGVVRARDLWDHIIKHTYEFAEPGVIFIDRVNEMNNLNYCETIAATNPCGEQPLPPYGACILGSVNLARMVCRPFSSSPAFNFDLLRKVVRLGVRFLDNVIDVTQYPLEQQRLEAENKRRIGLGISGLSDVFMQMEMPYGSNESWKLTRKIMSEIKEASYSASVDLGIEKGAFPLYEDKPFNQSPNVTSLPAALRHRIEKYGIRNGVLNTVAPNGTISIYYGNISSGIEPSFAHTSKRKVLQPDGTPKVFKSYNYAYRLWLNKFGAMAGTDSKSIKSIPSMQTAGSLSVDDHLKILSAAQAYVDASISKTINCPADMSFEAFKHVYDDAIELRCKSCTTYRPSGVRGSVIDADDTHGNPLEEAITHELSPKELAFEVSEHTEWLDSLAADVIEATVNDSALTQRPDTLSGITHKIKWPGIDQAFYLVINERDGKPFEVFITSKSSMYTEWTTALTLMISAIMRRGGDTSFIATELQEVVSATNAGWMNGKHYPSLVAYIGHLLEDHLQNAAPTDGVSGIEFPSETAQVIEVKFAGGGGPSKTPQAITHASGMMMCSRCNHVAVIHTEGCVTCTNCGHSNCG